MARAEQVTVRGDPSIDGLLSGIRWDSKVLTWAFPTSASQYSSGYGQGELSNNFAPLSEAQQTAVKSILALYTSYLNVELRQLSGWSASEADIKFAQSNAPKTAWAYYPDQDEGGDVWFNTDARSLDAPVKGSYGWMTFLHEIGHAFGLKHGHEAEGRFDALPYERDTLEYTVMTYRSYEGAGTTSFVNGSADYPQTLMMGDIAALQSLYGANFSGAGKSLIYSWSPTTGETFVNGVSQGATVGNRVFMTVWTAGAEVTYDLSKYTTDLSIDLRPGEWSTFANAQLARLDRSGSQLASGNVANAEYVSQGGVDNLIRHAIGGAGNDRIIGNAADNRLTGGAGNDVIDGGFGSNTAVFSGKSTDYLWSKQANGAWRIVDQRANGDGTDQLVNIQYLSFSDGTLAIDAAPPRAAKAPAAAEAEAAPTTPAPSAGPESTLPSITLAPTPVFDFATAYRNLMQTSAPEDGVAAELMGRLALGEITADQVVAELMDAAGATTSVVALSYQFFTGAIPSEAGMRWMIDAAGPNANNLNSAYFAGMDIEERFINFALALGMNGDSGAAFKEAYGALSPEAALAKLYAEINGVSLDLEQAGAMLTADIDPGEGVLTRWEHLMAAGGGDAVGAKAAMAGWLLAEAVESDAGVYARIGDAFLADLVDGAEFGVNLIGVYGAQPLNGLGG